MEFARGEADPGIDGASKIDFLALEQQAKASTCKNRQASGS
jgi:hypothetical protein